MSFQGGFEKEGRIRMAECLRQAVLSRWAHVRRRSFTIRVSDAKHFTCGERCILLYPDMTHRSCHQISVLSSGCLSISFMYLFFFFCKKKIKPQKGLKHGTVFIQTRQEVHIFSTFLTLTSHRLLSFFDFFFFLLNADSSLFRWELLCVQVLHIVYTCCVFRAVILAR